MANVVTVAELAPAELVTAFAGVVGVGSADVDVADSDGDQEGRRWDVAVLCGYCSGEGTGPPGRQGQRS